jgi:hypothetical protein
MFERVCRLLNSCFTFSPIGDMSFRLIFPRSGSPIKRPIVSSSRRIKRKGSQILQDRIFGRGMLPSTSLMTCLSTPSAIYVCQTIQIEQKRCLPGSRILMELVMTCKIAVLWKKGAAPTVVPGIRVVMAMSCFEERDAIYKSGQSLRTRDGGLVP